MTWNTVLFGVVIGGVLAAAASTARSARKGWFQVSGVGEKFIETGIVFRSKRRGSLLVVLHLKLTPGRLAAESLAVEPRERHIRGGFDRTARTVTVADLTVDLGGQRTGRLRLSIALVRTRGRSAR